MIKRIALGSVLVAAMILTGCGDDSTQTELTKGYLIDSPVVNADYDCVADGDYNKTTGAEGVFQCRNMQKVRFRIGGLVLGEVAALPGDGYVFPQDIVGDENLSDPRVVALAQFLQSLDADDNLSNGIQISDALKARRTEAGVFDPELLPEYLEELAVPQERHRTRTEAWEHLRETVQTKRGEGNKTDIGPHGPGGNGTGDIDRLPLSTLTQDLKDAIAYMGNEERLAQDVYRNLYAYHADRGTTVFQLQNIADAETRHVQTVQSIVRKYGLTEANLTNVSTPVGSAENMPSGQYNIPAIQNLYDTLYAKGQASERDALEVGCMVEVTDINDLNEKIVLAQESNASDVEEAFVSLRNASYNHYGAFDSGLKALGASEGCCAIGTVDGVDYCHTDYPQNSQGGGKGNQRGGRRGN